MTKQRAAALAGRLELDVMTVGVCLACLSFAAMPLLDGDERAARQAARRLVPDLWREGLKLPTLLALERARRDGVADAREALDDVTELGERASIVEAVVWRLANDLAEDAMRLTHGMGVRKEVLQRFDELR